MNKKFDLKFIISELANGGIVPVIGPELLQVEIEGKKQSFRLWLATRLAEEMNLPADELEDKFHPVEEVMLRHYKINSPNSVIPYQKINWLITQQKFAIPDALLKLTAIKDFRFFLTITWEPFLEEALKASWKISSNQIRILENNLSKKPEDIDKFTSRDAKEQFDPSYIDKLYTDEAPPTIYYLYGRPSRFKTFALSEDDVLEANLLFHSSIYRPNELFHYLTERRLLLLGCNFPNWLARFFISMTNPDPKRPSPQPVFVSSDAACCRDQNLTDFLIRRDAIVIDEGSVENFIDQLYHHWLEKNSQNKQPEAKEHHFTEGSIFISYASEDQIEAEQLFREIKEMNIPVWLDKRELKPGDEWAAKIESNIRNCSIFIPMISAKSLNANSERYFRLEWEMAMSMNTKSAKNLKIFPARIDQSSYNNELVPASFQKLHWLDVPHGNITDDSLAVLNTEFYRIKS